ncbi:MAG: YceI family protein [Planctomycetes bacterium]|nr:YceI family protein [Planctomycetota bacterium]
MTPKLRMSILALALLAVAGISVAALVNLGDKVHVTIQSEEDAARRGPDPLALVAADVGAARDEVRALGEGLADRLQLLHDALEGGATERERSLEAAIAGLRAELAALRTRVAEDARNAASSRAELGTALARLAEGRHAGAAADAGGAEVPAAVVPAALPLAGTGITPEVEAAVAIAADPGLEAGPEAPAPKPATKGFLSFKIPSQAFAFDRRQRYSVLPNLSRVGFDARSTLHDFSGVTTSVEGDFTANLARPAEGCGGFVRAKSASLDTGLEARDESMRELLEPAKHPDLRFDWESFEASSVDAAAQKVAGVARGRLTVHGVTKPIAMTVAATVDASKRLAIEGQTKIRLSDYGVKPPSKLGLISVEDEATLWIALRARTLGPADEAAR